MSVVSNRDVMTGKPTIRGTRITVESILERLAAGEVVNALAEHGNKMQHAFSVITAGHIRIRPTLAAEFE